MVESEAQQLSEEIMLGGIVFGHTQMQAVIGAIHELVRDAGKPDWDWKSAAKNEALIATVTAAAQGPLNAAYQTRQKQERTNQLRQVYSDVHAKLADEAAAQGTPKHDGVVVDNILFDLEARIVRSQILSGEPRIDGRDTRTVRPISIRMGVLPRVHGSALFTRGETQALVIATLGTKQNEQVIDALMGEYRDRFLMHYNMPPFATGETGRVGTPKRREIGHGRLAKRSLVPLLPNAADFQYTIRLVSEITESNGSSSMASVCGGSLAMLDAGVPVKDLAVLTDILGDEDHLGDMDFKVAGTEQGITALQMDIKIQGITKEIMQVALAQARDGRLHILTKMREATSGARTELSAFAPRMLTMKINPEKIRDVIGKGGATIRALTEETGCQIDISDDGTIVVSSADLDRAHEAQRRISELTAEVEVGQVYDGSVLRLLDFGAIVQVLPGRDGLLHISEIANYRIANINDVLKVGQPLRVKVIEADDKGRLRLSVKAIGGIEQQTEGAAPAATEAPAAAPEAPAAPQA